MSQPYRNALSTAIDSANRDEDGGDAETAPGVQASLASAERDAQPVGDSTSVSIVLTVAAPPDMRGITTRMRRVVDALQTFKTISMPDCGTLRLRRVEVHCDAPATDLHLAIGDSTVEVTGSSDDAPLEYVLGTNLAVAHGVLAGAADGLAFQSERVVTTLDALTVDAPSVTSFHVRQAAPEHEHERIASKAVAALATERLRHAYVGADDPSTVWVLAPAQHLLAQGQPTNVLLHGDREPKLVSVVDLRTKYVRLSRGAFSLDGEPLCIGTVLQADTTDGSWWFGEVVAFRFEGGHPCALLAGRVLQLELNFQIDLSNVCLPPVLQNLRRSAEKVPWPQWAGSAGCWRPATQVVVYPPDYVEELSCYGAIGDAMRAPALLGDPVGVAGLPEAVDGPPLRPLAILPRWMVVDKTPLAQGSILDALRHPGRLAGVAFGPDVLRDVNVDELSAVYRGAACPALSILVLPAQVANIITARLDPDDASARRLTILAYDDGTTAAVLPAIRLAPEDAASIFGGPGGFAAMVAKLLEDDDEDDDEETETVAMEEA
jgi:hypothetical protein